MTKTGIKASSDLITTREQTRAGFKNFALENQTVNAHNWKCKGIENIGFQSDDVQAWFKITDIRPMRLAAVLLVRQKNISCFTELTFINAAL